MENLLIVWALGLFGIALYAVVQVWKKVKTEGFDFNKFFADNKFFWLVCMVLNLLFSIGVVYVHGFQEVLRYLGFALEEDNHAGYVLLGVALALGSDKTKLTGQKTLNTTK